MHINKRIKDAIKKAENGESAFSDTLTELLEEDNNLTTSRYKNEYWRIIKKHQSKLLEEVEKNED